MICRLRIIPGRDDGRNETTGVAAAGDRQEAPAGWGSNSSSSEPVGRRTPHPTPIAARSPIPRGDAPAGTDAAPPSGRLAGRRPYLLPPPSGWLPLSPLFRPDVLR
jgi:hypothetical protein